MPRAQHHQEGVSTVVGSRLTVPENLALYLSTVLPDVRPHKAEALERGTTRGRNGGPMRQQRQVRVITGRLTCLRHWGATEGGSRSR